MKIISDSVNESCIDGFNRVYFLHFDNNWADTIYNFVLIFRSPQIGNFSSVQKIVNVFNKSLRDNLGVSYQEANRLPINTCNEHEFLHEVPKLSWTKILSDFDLLELHFSHVRG